MENQLVKFDHLGGRIQTMMGPLKGIMVRDLSENAAAKGALVTVKALGKEIDALKVAVLLPHKTFIEQVNTRVKQLMAPLDEAEAEIKRAMTAFAAAEQYRINEERKKAEAIMAAERKAAEDKAAAEIKRLEAEERKRQQVQAEEEMARKAFGVETNEEVEAKVKQAEELAAKMRAEAAAKAKKAQDELEARARAAEKSFAAQGPKNTRTIKKFEILEPLEVPQKYWQINEALLGQDVRSGVVNIPGVRIYEEQTVVAR